MLLGPPGADPDRDQQQELRGLVDWGEVFNDQVLATAIFDCLLHHATTVNIIKGDSHRLRENTFRDK